MVGLLQVLRGVERAPAAAGRGEPRPRPPPDIWGHPHILPLFQVNQRASLKMHGCGSG